MLKFTVLNNLYIFFFGLSVLGYLLANETMLKHMPNVALALFLLLEQFSGDTPSFWTPYLNMLPSSYSTVLYFSSQDMQELKGSPTLGNLNDSHFSPHNHQFCSNNFRAVFHLTQWSYKLMINLYTAEYSGVRQCTTAGSIGAPRQLSTDFFSNWQKWNCLQL